MGKTFSIALWILVTVSLCVFSQDRVSLGWDANMLGDQKIIAGMIQAKSTRIYVDGRDKIHGFKSEGGDPIFIYPLELEPDPDPLKRRWISSFTAVEGSPLVGEGEDLLIVSTVKRILEKKKIVGLDFRMLFLRCHGNQADLLGFGYDPTLKDDPDQINFRNLEALPDGRFIANKWVHSKRLAQLSP